MILIILTGIQLLKVCYFPRYDGRKGVDYMIKIILWKGNFNFWIDTG